FATPRGSALSDDDLAAIEHEDSLIGWTVANVAKRTTISESQAAMLRRLLQNAEDPIVRWRAAHVLGAHPSEDNVTALLDALNDPYHWVRYGAVRSLIELAARSSDLRPRIFE